MQDFLNPRSMVTPGAAGGIVMLVANTFWVTFGIAQEWTAFAISAVISVLIVAKYAAPLWERGCYFLLNALIIFCMATGAATVGYVAAGPDHTGGGGSDASGEVPANPPRLAQLTVLIGSAEAASPGEIDTICGAGDLDDRTRTLCQILREQREGMAGEAPPPAPATEPRGAAPEAAESATETTETPPQTDGPKKETRPFFRPWFQSGQ